jgi:glycosyltransferase involved in cell wall biosynthesis
MPTYNTAIDVLREAVDSILKQTFQDFEFIIIDDGSTNGSIDYLQNLTDKRIKLIRNPYNLGITKSLNIGFQAAQGKYIARMDSDDIALPTRLEKQFVFIGDRLAFQGSGCFSGRFPLFAKSPVTMGIQSVSVGILLSPKEVVFHPFDIWQRNHTAVEDSLLTQLQ